MSGGQLAALMLGNIVTVLAAILGSSGYWSYKQRKLERSYEKEDESDFDLKAFENSLERCVKANLVTMSFILIPWQERIMARDEKLVGVDEHDSLKDLYTAYRELGGNSTVQRRQEYIDSAFDIVPDEDIEIIHSESEKE